MGGIALVLLQLGYKITGSDLLQNQMTQRLIKAGAEICFQHSEKNIKNTDFIIISSAISLKNKEIIAANKKNIPVLLRAEMLQILMQFKFGIAISGTHGKTTTTAMIVETYITSGRDPTFINGGLIKSLNTFSKLGSSPYFIVEADESDSSFLCLKPKIAIVTNIESDHIDHYNGSFNRLKNGFLNFINQIPLYGIVIVCIDNSAISSILHKIKCKIITYGFRKNADICISCYRQSSFTGFFKLTLKDRSDVNITLNIPGKHNALNAAAAVALAIQQGIKSNDIITALKNFQGTVRRFEFIGDFIIKNSIINQNSTMIIDDYGHHPTELYETIKTIRVSWPNKKLIMIFQPHRYTRTHNLYYDFIRVLSNVDALLILNVYSSNEPFIQGADSQSLYKDIKKITKIDATFISDHKFILSAIIPKLNGDDIILIQGAGNIERIVHNIFNKKVIK